MEIKLVPIENPESLNLILGQTHFIKSSEDLYEALVSSIPGIKFGLAFCEASGPCLVRAEGNDPDLKELAARNALNIGAGHVFIIFMKEGYPMNLLGAIKDVPEVCNIYCATANPLTVVVAEDDMGRGVLGVIDGERSKGIEKEEDVRERRSFLREIGYKL
ncbi:MAG: adenosine-specific kinase [Thermoplasmata archaeon]